LANPNGLNWGERRVKNDIVDACDLADMLRLGRLPEAWIAPPAIRELRELVRYRAKLVQLRSGLKAQVHAVMAKEGVLPSVGDMFCAAGQVQLDEMALGPNYTIRVESLRDLIEVYDREVVMLEREIHQRGIDRGREHRLDLGELCLGCLGLCRRRCEFGLGGDQGFVGEVGFCRRVVSVAGASRESECCRERDRTQGVETVATYREPTSC
jgi:hypothetical protein